jgi:hypothetical protein
VRSFASSGNFSGSGTLQSMQRNFRPPVLTSINRIGLRHFEHVGGGRFLGMEMLTLDRRGALPNSQSPYCRGRGGDVESITLGNGTGRSGVGLEFENISPTLKVIAA